MLNTEDYKHEYLSDEEQELADRKEIAAAFIKAREERGLSQDWVAGTAGIPTWRYIQMEQAVGELPWADICRVVGALILFDESLMTPFNRWLSRVKRLIRCYLAYSIKCFLRCCEVLFASAMLFLTGLAIFILQLLVALLKRVAK